jgi:hypothetical protein
LYFLSEGCCLNVAAFSLWGVLSDKVGSVICHSQSVAIYQYLYQGFMFHVFYSSAMYIQYIQSFFQSRLGTTDYAPLVTIS